MVSKEQKHKEQSDSNEEESEELTSASKTVETGAEKKSGELDEILDEIDTLLESNAEEFVASYVQKGGE